LYELFRRSVERHGGNNCLGTRNLQGLYEFLSYNEVSEKVDALASALAGTGLKRGSCVGVFGANCAEWMMAMQACNRMSYVCVPLYDTLGEGAVEFIIKHASVSTVFVQGSKLPALAKALPKLKGVVKSVVYWGKPPEDAVKSAADEGVLVSSFEDFLASGEGSIRPPEPPSSEDLCTIMYTSGTTGDPKGVMIRHRNVLGEILALQRYLISVGYKQDEHDVFLSYLPLAHIFDRVAEEFYLSIGGSIGYWRGDIKGLNDDIAALRPTLFVGVPRVFERIQQGVQAKMRKAGFLASMLFNYAVRHKKYYLDRGYPQDKASPLFDSLVFSKIKAALGGRVQIIISGGAPLSTHVEDFLKVTMCAVVVQGYGLTETMAGAAVTLPNGESGNVGPPLPGVQMRLESVPEIGYDALADPPRGEVLVKGDIIFEGYYQLEEKTTEVLEPSGWFHTGDIGEILPDGSLKIIDRKKNIFKLSQGEYVAVEKVESVYSKSNMVDQIWVYGNSFHSSLVCVVVPNTAAIAAWAKEKGMQRQELEEICATAEAREAVLSELVKTGREGGLKGFEIVKGVRLEPKPFDQARDLITPTFKLKRPQLLKYYQAEVDAMYAAMGN